METKAFRERCVLSDDELATLIWLKELGDLTTDDDAFVITLAKEVLFLRRLLQSENVLATATTPVGGRTSSLLTK